MQPDRPVRLTFPAREPGARRIMAGKLQVGHALADHRMRWTGYLWAVADRPGYGFRGEVKAGNLPALREQVGGRLELGGPWWAAEHPDGIERDGLCEVLGDEERSDEEGPGEAS